jgi:two-component system phosphate regulon sensor histidine kinase PhoR
MLRSIRWRIAAPYVILVLISTIGLSMYLSTQVRQVYLDSLETHLLAEARTLADAAQPLLAAPENKSALDSLAKRWSALLGARVTIIAADGSVLADSEGDAAQMENHLYRPEVQQALATGQGNSIRLSQTVGYDMMYVALPVTAEEQMTGFVRVALPLGQIESSISGLRHTILTAGLLVGIVAIMLALFIAEHTARPLRRLAQAADHVAAGDLAVRLVPTSRDEVGHLTLAFNHMADQLQDKMDSLAREQNLLSAVLEHMADGILITDAAGQVQLINPAAARLLGTTQAQAVGHSFVQVVRDHRLVEVWESCGQENDEQVSTVESDRLARFLRVIVTPLRETGWQDRLVVFQDLTQMHRADTMRRDFVSNISHELRTPLASLRALVDTLRDGAMDDPPAAQRFLDRIETEVDAMTQMVQELLELSRIESGQVPVRLAATPVAELVTPPVERLLPQAERANLSLSVDLPADLPAVLADAERVQQVVTNLVHNAIKFTRPGGQIHVRAYAADEDGSPGPRDGSRQSVVVEVADSGVGIPTGALPRIFERFYKADRARSGGGTGLGLAIAKHIIQGHGGRIWAESIEGRGSTFYFSLVAAP